jgi:hypothetical protein
MRYLVSGRGSGRTTALTAWLAGGHPVDGWPGWSRLLVVADQRMLHWTRDNGRAVDAWLRAHGCSGGLGKVLITPNDCRYGMRGLHPVVRFAIDDFDRICSGPHSGLDLDRNLVELVAVEGETTTPDAVLERLHTEVLERHGETLTDLPKPTGVKQT